LNNKKAILFSLNLDQFLNAGQLVSGIQGWTELAFDPETAVVDGVLSFERERIRA